MFFIRKHLQFISILKLITCVIMSVYKTSSLDVTSIRYFPIVVNKGQRSIFCRLDSFEMNYPETLLDE